MAFIKVVPEKGWKSYKKENKKNNSKGILSDLKRLEKDFLKLIKEIKRKIKNIYNKKGK